MSGAASLLKEPQTEDCFIALGAAIGGSPSLFAAQIKADIPKYAQAVKASGTKAD